MMRLGLWVATGLGILFPAASPSDPASATSLAWSVVDWPYARDAWPAGRAFACRGAACPSTAILTVRVKLGMCNCETGVRDDAEVDALSDVDLISSTFIPEGPGDVLQSGRLTGRIRAYHAVIGGKETRLVGVVLNRDCDVVAGSLITPASDRRNWATDFDGLVQTVLRVEP
jgi:hypothetical protein